MAKITDLEFNWFTAKYGEGWDVWRELGASWISTKDYSVDSIRNGLSKFLEEYLVPNFLSDPVDLFHQPHGCIATWLNETNLSNNYKARINNTVYNFINWIIETYYSEPDDNGDLIPLFNNPLSIEKSDNNLQESVYNVLPYVYIKRLRSILCPEIRGNFKDWKWAYEYSDQINKGGRYLGDWILVDKNSIDKKDPDCVWKKITLKKNRSYRLNGKLEFFNKGEILYFIWSPVRAMALFIKLMLPLRTFQLRMLDSGESDTWRYQKGQWVQNAQHSFIQGTEQRPWQKGVFRRIKTPDIGDIMTGLYINTNKTADRNKDEISRGYIIPWQHEDVLFWLEKLRNWQEKYNPIDQPTSIHDVAHRFFGSIKTKTQRDELGDICFLFRHAAAVEDKNKQMPVTSGIVNGLWFSLLKFFENQLYEEGIKLSDGRKIEFVLPGSDKTTLFPLHSLRVSLITCYAMEGEIPAPVLSKLLVGHSRLIMTMHYTKVTPTMMAKKMKLAEEKIDSRENESLQTFLLDRSMADIELNTAFNEITSVGAMLKVKNPAGWQEKSIGICLAGGNISRGEDNGFLSGCWNGGELEGKVGTKFHRQSVPHGLENCIRCRWFITDIRYIHALTAHFNNLSYQATESASLADELKNRQDKLLDEKYFCEIHKQKFKDEAELQSLERRIEKQLSEADEYCKDLISCFQIIRKLIKLEEQRQKDDKQQKIIALGSSSEISPYFTFLETESELRQLVQVCQDAEVHSDLRDELRFTSSVHHRSNYLNKALMRSGYMPFFMQMSDEMQLLAGNAMINAMVNKFDNIELQKALNKVVKYLESNDVTSNPVLIEHGIQAIQKLTKTPILKITELYSSVKVKGVSHEC